MRNNRNPQFSLGQTPVEDIVIDFHSRDDIPKILKALQHLHQDDDRVEAILNLIARDFSATANLNTGAEGMNFWQVLVLGTLRLGLSCDYDRLTELANQHATLRQMLGHGPFDFGVQYKIRTIGENLSRLQEGTLKMISWVIVNSVHEVLGVDEDTSLRGRCDSSVIKTNAHFPTDANLLLDAVRKILMLGGQAAQTHPELMGWRQYQDNYRKFKRRYNQTIKLRRSNSKSEARKEAREEQIREAYFDYLDKAEEIIARGVEAVEVLRFIDPDTAQKIERFVEHGKRQCEQIRTRVIQGENVPHEAKVFSLFEEHTEWISKGKAGVPVELGVRGAFLEDQHGLILNYRVMQGETDDKITVYFTEETRILFPNLRACSFDKGFYTPDNRDRLDLILDQVTLPKKGRLAEADQERESTEEFVTARKQHPAVESAIHSLQTHGLDRCRDRGIEGFKRYVGWGVIAFNLHKLGAILMEQEKEKERRQQRKAA